MIIKKNIDLSNYNSYKVKAIASKVYFPNTNNDIIEIFSNTSTNYRVIGGGNNVILANEKYTKDNFIIINDNFSKLAVVGDIITCEAGCNLKSLSKLAFKNNLSGLELFYDIPGTLGGSILMNAGSKNEAISDLIEDVTFLERKTLKTYTLRKNKLNWDYRYSEFQENDSIIISARLKLKKGNKTKIYEKIIVNYRQRHEKQPREYPNAGSVFKRPKGFYVGTLIEELGLKGHTIGGAKISEKHAGFIVNYNNATGADIINLILFIKERVFKEKGVILETEQIII